ncbi:hypothetical protein ACRRTK_017730 [Alexandromys fortis]
MAAPPPVCGPRPPQFRYPPPQFLKLQSPGFYMDERQRFWMVSSMFFTPGLYPLQPTPRRFGTSSILILWQMNPTMDFTPIPLSVIGLPRMWRRESLMFYRGSDSSVWELRQHIQVPSLRLPSLSITPTLMRAELQRNCFCKPGLPVSSAFSLAVYSYGFLAPFVTLMLTSRMALLKTPPPLNLFPWFPG